jgi:hypothetical protein
MTILYHASPEIIEQPVYSKSGAKCDFGLGFYTHISNKLAIDWAYRKIRKFNIGEAYISRYEYKENSEVSIFVFGAADLLNYRWLDYILFNRGYRDYVGANNYQFVSELDVDVIVGPIANQFLGAVFNNFLQGIYGDPFQASTKELLFKSMINKELLFNQVCFKTQFAINQTLRFVGSDVYGAADRDKYVKD